MRTLFISERVTRFSHDALPHPIELEQKPDADVPHEADGTCRRLWPTSLVLTRYLCAHPHLVAGKRVVELGAGAGCVGLACAALGAAHVVISDISDAALSLCRDNVARNLWLAPRVSVAPCAWGDGSSIAALSRLAGGGGFDVVVASEVVYKQVCLLRRYRNHPRTSQAGGDNVRNDHAYCEA
jgi:predicted nicotinamide N-methyase